MGSESAFIPCIARLDAITDDLHRSIQQFDRVGVGCEPCRLVEASIVRVPYEDEIHQEWLIKQLEEQL
jgi:hypothetical protein